MYFKNNIATIVSFLGLTSFVGRTSVEIDIHLCASVRI